jgi:UDP-N-acetylmuramate--alanine ligase
MALPNENVLAELVAEVAKPGDFVICLGAGSISKWAANLPAQLDAEFAKKNKERA